MSWIVCHLLFSIIMKMKQHRALSAALKHQIFSRFFFYNVHCWLLKDQDSSKNGCFVLDNVRKMWVQLSYTHIWAGEFDNIEMCNTSTENKVTCWRVSAWSLFDLQGPGPLLRAWCALQVCAFLVVYSLRSKDAHHTIVGTNVNVK